MGTEFIGAEEQHESSSSFGPSRTHARAHALKNTRKHPQAHTHAHTHREARAGLFRPLSRGSLPASRPGFVHYQKESLQKSTPLVSAG